jgi:hypothetical protein
MSELPEFGEYRVVEDCAAPEEYFDATGIELLCEGMTVELSIDDALPLEYDGKIELIREVFE